MKISLIRPQRNNLAFHFRCLVGQHLSHVTSVTYGNSSRPFHEGPGHLQQKRFHSALRAQFSENVVGKTLPDPALRDQTDAPATEIIIIRAFPVAFPVFTSEPARKRSNGDLVTYASNGSGQEWIHYNSEHGLKLHRPRAVRRKLSSQAARTIR